MIIGVGCDVVQIPRIEKLVASHGDSFLRRIFSKAEIQLIVEGPEKCRYIAKRFAAKEAFAKAVGTGIGSAMRFCDIEIFKSECGKPFFSKETLMLVGHSIEAFISLSDDYPVAMAQVVLCSHKHAFY